MFSGLEGMHQPNIHSLLARHNTIAAEFGGFTITITKASSTDVLVQVFDGTTTSDEMQTQANVAITLLNQKYPELGINLKSFSGVTVQDE